MARVAIHRALRSLTLAIVLSAPLGIAQVGTAVRAAEANAGADPAPFDPLAAPPRLTRSVLRESSARMLLVGRAREATRTEQMSHLRLRLNLETRRRDHVALFVGLDRGRTAFEFPGLGATVPLGLNNALLYGSTMDGRIRLDWNGRWTTELQFPSTIRRALGQIHFQAATLRELNGGMTLLVSNPLTIDLVARASNPIERLLGGANANGLGMSSTLDPTPDFFIDPFGNRISRSRNLR